MNTKYKPVLVALLISSFLMLPTQLDAHCQVPCGIFDDHMRVQAMLEHAVTIEKSMKLINELAAESDAQSINQRVRWVMTKEEHAEKIMDTISAYFLAQRVKTDMDDYTKRLEKHHAVMLAAMKTKQSVDTKTVKQLKKAIKALEDFYPEHKH